MDVQYLILAKDAENHPDDSVNHRCLPRATFDLTDHPRFFAEEPQVKDPVQKKILTYARLSARFSSSVYPEPSYYPITLRQDLT